MRSSWLIGPACLAIGLGVGAIMASSSPPPASLHVIERPSLVVAAERAGLGRDELAAVVREELARALAERQPGANAAAPTTLAEAHERLDDEQVVHAEAATQLIGAAVSRGSWGEADRAALWTQLEGLPAPIQAQITGQLAVAVNQGQLRLETDGMPL